MGTKVSYFDAEWANSRNRSICQIGLMCEDFESDDPIFPELNIYVNPEDGFDQICIGVHGITSKKVANEKTFAEVWPLINPYFSNAVIIGHNVLNADLLALERNLVRYNIDIPEMYYLDTLEMSRDLIPSCYVENYSLSSLCRYFDIDIDNAHDAFDDACACKDLFKNLQRIGNVPLEKYIHKYNTHSYGDNFENYVSSPKVRKAITDFYGIVQGIMADNQINEQERMFLKEWKKESSSLLADSQLKKLVDYIDEALSDGILTESEIAMINSIVSEYYVKIKASPETTATQILDGYLKGLAADKRISTAECKGLEKWLYDNSFLSGHFPYDNIFRLVENVLEDGVVTAEESDDLLEEIRSILNPVDELSSRINSVNGKVVCLSGCFDHGSKNDVTKYVTEKGGSVVDSLTKKVDILVVGNQECEAFSNGSYGTKVKKAIEFNKKGCNIQIIKERDLFN